MKSLVKICSMKTTAVLVLLFGLIASTEAVYRLTDLLKSNAAKLQTLTKYYKPTGYFKPECKKYCSNSILYVCGSDGKTYVNDCILKKAICEDKTGRLIKLHDGPCKEMFGQQLKGLQFHQVCGNDKLKYSNIAFLELSGCLKKTFIRAVTVDICKCDSTCYITGSKCETGCPNVYNPVCGSDGQTYANECILIKQNCINGKDNLKKLHNGICKADYEIIVGIEDYSPVCDTLGSTYSSKAFVEVAQCEGSFLKAITLKPVCY